MLSGRCKFGFLWCLIKCSYKHKLHMLYNDRFYKLNIHKI